MRYSVFMKKPNSFQELGCKRIAYRSENRDTASTDLTIPSVLSLGAFVLVCSCARVLVSCACDILDTSRFSTIGAILCDVANTI